MLLIGRIESLQSKENTFSRLFVTQGEMVGKVIKFRAAPKFFSNIRKGTVVRVLGDFAGDTFVVSEPAHVVRDFTAEDIRTLAQKGLGVSKADLHRIFEATGTVDFKGLVGWLKDAEIEKLDGLPHGKAIAHFVSRLTENQDQMAVLELISKIGLDLPVAVRAVDLFRRRAARRFKDSGAPVAEYLRAEPYALAQVEGAEWKDADSLAKSLGLPGGFDPKRVAGAVHAFLWSKARQGHCFFPRPDTVYQVWRWLGGKDAGRGKRERRLIDDIIERMVEEGKLCFESKPYRECVKALMDKVYPGAPPGANRARQGVLYLPEIYWSEKRLARLLADCALSFPDVRIDADRLVEAAREIAAETAGVTLNAEQERAVRNVARYPVTVLMGAAGTGKTTTVNVILKALLRAAPEIEIAPPLAPTGRAAQLLGDSTGAQGSTIHRYLKLVSADEDYIEGNGSEEAADKDNRENPVFITVDESSMATVIVFRKLLERVKPGSRLLIVGDPNQLEAIGPGSVLRDLKDAEFPDGGRGFPRIPVTVLSRVYRQGQGDPVLENAWRILGAAPESPAVFEEVPGRFEIIPAGQPGEVAEKAKEVVEKLLGQGIAFEDILVLVPRHDGPAGAARLNERIRRIVNPDGKPIEGTSYRIGDHVIAIQNDYQDEDDPNRLRETVYNGTRGIIETVGGTEDAPLIGVLFAGKEKLDYYRPEEIDRYLAPAYALTVHKAQGCQARAVVLACDPNSSMLNKPLLYTAVTRCRDGSVYLIGPKEMWENACLKMPDTRYSKFAWRLRDELGWVPKLIDWSPGGVEAAAAKEEAELMPVRETPGAPGVFLDDFDWDAGRKTAAIIE